MQLRSRWVTLPYTVWILHISEFDGWLVSVCVLPAQGAPSFPSWVGRARLDSQKTDRTERNESTELWRSLTLAFSTEGQGVPVHFLQNHYCLPLGWHGKMSRLACVCVSWGQSVIHALQPLPSLLSALFPPTWQLCDEPHMCLSLFPTTMTDSGVSIRCYWPTRRSPCVVFSLRTCAHVLFPTSLVIFPCS